MLLSAKRIKCRYTLLQPKSLFIRTYISLSEFSSNSSPPNGNEHGLNAKGLPQATFQDGKYFSPWTKETNKSFAMVVKMLLERNSIQKFEGIGDTASKVLAGEANLENLNKGSSYTWVLSLLWCWFLKYFENCFVGL